MGVSDQRHDPAALSPPKWTPGTHWIVGWVDLRHRHWRKNSLPLPGIEPRSFGLYLDTKEQ
jgi:hypothetical protein